MGCCFSSEAENPEFRGSASLNDDVGSLYEPLLLGTAPSALEDSPLPRATPYAAPLQEARTLSPPLITDYEIAEEMERLEVVARHEPVKPFLPHRKPTPTRLCLPDIDEITSAILEPFVLAKSALKEPMEQLVYTMPPSLIEPRTLFAAPSHAAMSYSPLMARSTNIPVEREIESPLDDWSAARSAHRATEAYRSPADGPLDDWSAARQAHTSSIGMQLTAREKVLWVMQPQEAAAAHEPLMTKKVVQEDLLRVQHGARAQHEGDAPARLLEGAKCAAQGTVEAGVRRMADLQGGEAPGREAPQGELPQVRFATAAPAPSFGAAPSTASHDAMLLSVLELLTTASSLHASQQVTLGTAALKEAELGELINVEPQENLMEWKKTTHIEQLARDNSSRMKEMEEQLAREHTERMRQMEELLARDNAASEPELVKRIAQGGVTDELPSEREEKEHAASGFDQSERETGERGSDERSLSRATSSLRESEEREIISPNRRPQTPQGSGTRSSSSVSSSVAASPIQRPRAPLASDMRSSSSVSSSHAGSVAGSSSGSIAGSKASSVMTSALGSALSTATSSVRGKVHQPEVLRAESPRRPAAYISATVERLSQPRSPKSPVSPKRAGRENAERAGSVPRWR
jgi:hypothetical protein